MESTTMSLWTAAVEALHQTVAMGIVAIMSGAFFGISALSSKSTVEALEKVDIDIDALHPKVRSTLITQFDRRLKHARVLHGVSVFAAPLTGGSGALAVVLKTFASRTNTSVVVVVFATFFFSIVWLIRSRVYRDVIRDELRRLTEDIALAKRTRAEWESLIKARAEIVELEHGTHDELTGAIG